MDTRLPNPELIADLEGNKKREEFLALLAHELRNPLSPISTATTIIKRAGIAHPAVQQALATIERQVGQLNRLVDDLTSMSRIASNKIVLQCQPFQLAHICESAVESLQTQIDARHHRLRINCDQVQMAGDATRVQQIIANLLGNATKFTPIGGEINLTIKEEEERVIITVQDNGVGINPTNLDKIYDPFWQEARMSGTGLGIGLTLTKTLVDLHGGLITVASDGKGKGTTAEVRLPLIPANPPCQHEGVRVLVIDDNVDHANNLAILLEMEDFQCRVAYDGPTGIDEADTFKPDVIFLDIGMPGMDGYQVIAKLLATCNRPYIVAITGFGQPSDRQKTKTAGFDEHLVKPPKAEELFGILAKVGERKRSCL